MKPTDEQLEAVARVISDEYGDGYPVSTARAAWDVIAPLVLAAAEDAASECTVERCECQERIRALK